MNAPAKEPPVAIVIPPALVALLDELTQRMSRVTGESPNDTRRAVELSVLSRGCAAVQVELTEAEDQAAKMGHPL